MKNQSKPKKKKPIDRKKKIKPNVFTARSGQKPPKISSTYTFFFLISIWGTLLSGFLSNYYQNNQKKIFFHRFEPHQMSDSVISTPEFTIPKGVKVVEFELSTSIPIGNELVIEGEVYDEEDLKIGEFEEDLYYLQGVADGEAWSEKKEIGSQYFRVDSAGKYQIEFFLHFNNTHHFLSDLSFSVKTGEKSIAQMFEYLLWIFIWVMIIMSLAYFPSKENS